jgi:hypothetical protein
VKTRRVPRKYTTQQLRALVIRILIAGLCSLSLARGAELDTTTFVVLGDGLAAACQREHTGTDTAQFVQGTSGRSNGHNVSATILLIARPGRCARRIAPACAVSCPSTVNSSDAISTAAFCVQFISPSNEGSGCHFPSARTAAVAHERLFSKRAGQLWNMGYQ